MDKVLKIKKKLQDLLDAEEVDEAKVTAMREKYLRVLKNTRETTNDKHLRTMLTTMYHEEILKHQKQLNKRLKEAKKSKESILKQVPEEMRIKLRKAENEIRYVLETRSLSDKGEAVKDAAGDVISAAATVIKIPAFAVIRISKRVIHGVGKIVLLPLRIPGYLWSKFVEPDGKYEGAIVTKMGKGLAKVTDEILTDLENGVRRV